MIGELTDQQRTKFLELITGNPTMSTREALYQAGVRNAIGSPDRRVSRAQAAQIVHADRDLHRDYETARGRDADATEKCHTHRSAAA